MSHEVKQDAVVAEKADPVVGDRVETEPTATVDLKDPSLYINRELSWLDFNRRVLEEAEDPSTPVMEKLKFLSIVSSNLDEFVMVRLGGLIRLFQAGVDERDSADMTIAQQIEAIAGKMHPMIADQYRCLREMVLPALKSRDIEIVPIHELSNAEKNKMGTTFDNNVFPVLTPLAVDAGHPFPFIGNRRLTLMTVFDMPNQKKSPQAFAFVEVPSVLPRLIPLEGKGPARRFVTLEDLVCRNIAKLFPGMKILSCTAFRITRNLDYNLHEDSVLDLLASLESELRDRTNQVAVRMEIEKSAPDAVINYLQRLLNLNPLLIFRVDGPLDLTGFMSLYDLPVPADMRDEPFNPRIPERFGRESNVFKVLDDGDVLLHHPYDSFAVIVNFLNHAADDPKVLAIKQTLYRTGKNSPVIDALRRAARNGKQVTAVVELKARFDEQSNIGWARQMEAEGINVVFGFVKWKVHCKATLVVRREKKKLVRYVHLSTGNYNSTTAKLYTDLGLLTKNPDFGNDVSSLFNVITGFNSWTGGDMFKPETVVSMFRKLYISPVNLRDRIIELINLEAELSTPSRPGRIIAKMNALVDTKTIRTLYKASQAGVRIDLIVRGICCLRPGVPGVSDNIRVISILDRFLEHTRIYYFHQKGDPVIYSGSADWMPRNFHRRVEALFPIESRALKSRIIKEILMTHLRDNVKARIMQPDGSYIRVKRNGRKRRLRSQSRLIAIARKGGLKSLPYEDLVKQLGKKKSGKLTA